MLHNLLAALALLQCVLASHLPTRTIVDILSQRSEFSILVELLQHHGLIPLINTSWNSTFLAPTNSAFAFVDAGSVTRDQLLYHFLNATLIFGQESGQVDLLLPSYLKHDNTNVYVHLQSDSINGKIGILEKDLLASQHRGAVQVISDVLLLPPTMCDSLYDHDELSIFAQMVNIEQQCNSLSTGVTLFAPHDEAFRLWKEVELAYVMSAFGSEDRQAVLRRHATEEVLKPQLLPKNITMLDGKKFMVDESLNIQSKNRTIEPFESWAITRDGIVDVYTQILSENQLITFTPEKYTLALGGYNFARALRLYGFDWLLDGSYHEPLTILVPVFRRSGSSLDTLSTETAGDTEFDSTPILYQFLKEQVSGEGEVSHLMDSALTLKGSKLPQRTHVNLHSSGRLTFNWQPVTSDVHVIGNTTLYTMGGYIPNPPSFSMALGPFFMSSHSLNFLDSLDMVDLPITNSWTYLVPSREAWEEQHLLKTYMSRHTDNLREFFSTMILDVPIYTDSKAQKASLLSGEEVHVEILHQNPSSEIALNISGSIINVENADVLFDNGVAHIVDQVVLPPDMEIGTRDLIVAGGRGDYVELLEERGFGHILDSEEAYTIIVPDMKAIERANYTADSEEIDLLLGLHIIPGDNSQQWLDGKPLTTQADEDLAVHWVSGTALSISLVSGSGQSVFVTEWADTRGPTASGSSVFFVDSFISPKWVNIPLLRPPFRLKANTLLFLGIVVGLIFTSLFLLVMLYLFSDNKDMDDRAPLLREDSTPNDLSEDEAQPAQPIRTAGNSEGRQYGAHLQLP